MAGHDPRFGQGDPYGLPDDEQRSPGLVDTIIALRNAFGRRKGKKKGSGSSSSDSDSDGKSKRNKKNRNAKRRNRRPRNGPRPMVIPASALGNPALLQQLTAGAYGNQTAFQGGQLQYPPAATYYQLGLPNNPLSTMTLPSSPQVYNPFDQQLPLNIASIGLTGIQPAYNNNNNNNNNIVPMIGMPPPTQIYNPSNLQFAGGMASPGGSEGQANLNPDPRLQTNYVRYHANDDQAPVPLNLDRVIEDYDEEPMQMWHDSVKTPKTVKIYFDVKINRSDHTIIKKQSLVASEDSLGETRAIDIVNMLLKDDQVSVSKYHLVRNDGVILKNGLKLKDYNIGNRDVIRLRERKLKNRMQVKKRAGSKNAMRADDNNNLAKLQPFSSRRTSSSSDSMPDYQTMY